MVTWGLANLGDISHRTRIAKLSDEIKAKPEKFKTLKGIADYWNEHVFSAYENFYDTDKKRDERKRAHELFAIQEKDRTEDQKKERRTTSGERNRFLPGWLPSFGPSPGCVRDLL